jgi:hypothetical protein
MAGVGGSKSRNEHDQIGRYGDKDTGTVQSGKQRKVDDNERVRQNPVDISSPEDLAENVLKSIGDVSVRFLNMHVFPVMAISCSHGQVCQEGDSGGERSKNVEEAFLLEDGISLLFVLKVVVICTYNDNTSTESVKAKGRNPH